tara:strand:+ start:103 stop:714 length:612 start_codon:yes stop_codon:yes gene_type:complete
MIENQIKKRGITDSEILNAMMKIKRHEFVKDGYEKFAYDDRPLPIGYKQTISQPYIVAFMTKKLNLRPHHKVLEIGTGSGYQAAVLSELSDYVYTIEIIPELAEKAKKVLKENDYDNISFRIGDGYQGWHEEAPFDRIIVTAAPKEIPDKLIEQLAPGGIMIIPYGESIDLQFIWSIKKERDGSIIKEKIIPVRFVPMVKQKF